MPKNNYKEWTEEEIAYLKKSKQKKTPYKEIAAKLGRTVSGISKKIQRLEEEALDQVDEAEKMLRFRKMCEYYMIHAKEDTISAAYKKFYISEHFFTHVAYSPSISDQEKIATFQKAYDHFIELYQVGYNKNELTEEELKTLKWNYCTKGMGLTDIAKIMNRSYITLSDAVKKNGWDKGGRKTAAKPLRSEEEKSLTSPDVFGEAKEAGMFEKADPAQYIDCAKEVVNEYNKKLEWFLEVSKEFEKCRNNIERLSKALEPLKL